MSSKRSRNRLRQAEKCRCVQFHHIPVEQLLLITHRCNDAAGMRIGKVGHHFRKHLQSDKKAVQRILMKLVSTLKEVIKQSLLVIDVALKQRLCEVALVGKMIEEAALGYAHGSDDFFDGCGGKSLGKNRFFGHLQNALTFAAAPI